MSSFKSLNPSDVISNPYINNKEWNFYFPSFQNDENFTLYVGKKFDDIFDIREQTTSGSYDRLVYDSINHQFYQSYSGSLINTSSLDLSLYYDNLTQIRKEESYIKLYNDKIIKQFPTGSGEEIRVLSVNQSIIGNKIKPSTFNLKNNSLFNITDDGFNNLIDIQNENTLVGNIFYSEGIIVITNQDYLNMFGAPIPPPDMENPSCGSVTNISKTSADFSYTFGDNSELNVLKLYDENDTLITTINNNNSPSFSSLTPGLGYYITLQSFSDNNSPYTSSLIQCSSFTTTNLECNFDFIAKYDH